jgi:mono/diheme cytochrome c family protein
MASESDTTKKPSGLKKGLKIVGIGVGIVALLAGGFVAKNVATWRPMFPDHPMPSGIEASDDPAVIATGKYLVDHVSHCGACHSPAESYTSLKPGEPAELKGGHEWHMGPLGTIRSVNITPDEATGIGKYTDAELARAIRHGVAKDGRGLLFMMGVGPTSDEDLIAIISYLRTVEPVANAVPESEVGVLGKVLFQTAMGFFASPHDYSANAPKYAAPGSASIERGTYLAEGPGWCVSCHTEYAFEDGSLTFVDSKGSGGVEPFPDETDPAFEFAAPNITKVGHMKGWDKEAFVKRFRGGRVHKGSPMPWESYAGMTDTDIESLWLWVQSLPDSTKNVGPVRRERGSFKG